MKRNINISNLRAFILIGHTPTLINKAGTYENYDLLATAQLIHKIMKDVFELNESDIVTFAYGKENDYKNLLEKTQRKIITQINQEEVLFQVPSDVTLYDYFETNESLLMMLRYKSTEKIKSDILLFLLDHGKKGFINDISYLMIYQAILEGKPNSLRIFNDCCYGGSIIPLIEAYSQLYNKSYSALRMNRKDTINLSFVKYYLSIISDSKKQQVLISLANRSSITTSGQFMMSIVALYPLKCSNTESYLADIKSRINQNHTNIYYQICGGKNNISDGIKFLRFLKDVDFEQIHPPVHEHRIFSSAGYYSKAFTFSRIHITPNIKLYGGSPGTSEMFLEFFLRNTNSNIDFDRMEKNITTIKEGYKEYPVREKDQQQTYWMRLFPKHDSTENFRGDCFLSQVQKELKKKISAMRGIRTLACDNIENLINIFTSKRNEYQQDHQQLCTSKWLNVQKSHEKIDKEEWNEQTSISRIAENEVRQISSISLISALSIQLPFEDSLKIIFHILPQEQSVIVFISILISENIHQAGLFCIDVMTELSQIEDEILQRNGIIPTSASRTFIFNCSNKLRIMILSCISTIINLKCQNSIEMIISKIQNIDMIKFGNFINPILQEIELKINSEGINDKTIHQQIFEEFSQSIKLLKDKINQSVEIMKISLQKFKEMPIEINVNPEEKIINKTKEDKTLNEIIHKISGSSNFSHHAILLSIMNPTFHSKKLNLFHKRY